MHLGNLPDNGYRELEAVCVGLRFGKVDHYVVLKNKNKVRAWVCFSVCKNSMLGNKIKGGKRAVFHLPLPKCFSNERSGFLTLSHSSSQENSLSGLLRALGKEKSNQPTNPNFWLLSGLNLQEQLGDLSKEASTQPGQFLTIDIRAVRGRNEVLCHRTFGGKKSALI